MAARKTKKNEDETPQALIPFEAGALAGFGNEYADDIALQRSTTPVSGGIPRLKASNGVVYLPGDTTPLETVRVAAVVALRGNSYWSGVYTPGDTSPPVCGSIQALGEPESKLVPSPDWPEVQAEACYGCPRNISPSKTCKNGLHVAVIHEDDLKTVKSAREATIAALQISSTGIAPFSKVSATLGEMKIPLFGALLEVRSTKLLPTNTYYTTVVQPVGVLSKPVVAALKKRVEEAARDLTAAAAPFVGVTSEAAAPEPPKPRTRKKSTAKKTGRKL